MVTNRLGKRFGIGYGRTAVTRGLVVRKNCLCRSDGALCLVKVAKVFLVKQTFPCIRMVFEPLQQTILFFWLPSPLYRASYEFRLVRGVAAMINSEIGT
jgi:hypothetical protein